MSEMEHDSELANVVEDIDMVNSYYLYYRLASLLIKFSYISNWRCIAHRLCTLAL